ncbi:MAG TPA: TVP38/TMEM64 family protein [Chloroflexota bacterium]|nr:TVP38/TMEM64 family protein [Chloroflexota bacterium]HUM67289.1 TVP38/TMEM64 family protein [Chloroflexota bacterium]
MTKQPFSPHLPPKNRTKLLALLFWLALIGSYYAFVRYHNLTMAESVQWLADWLTASLWGPLLFIALYIVGPLLFFPATLLSLLGGFVFGPIGIIYTVIGSNSSAMVAYGIGRYFGNGVWHPEGHITGLVQRDARHIQENSFETVLIMHLIFLPYELVNYTCGFLQIGWKPFLAGTALGSIVATISIVMMGASFGAVEQLVAGELHLNPVTLIMSIVLIGFSLTLSRLVKKRENHKLIG